VAKKSFELQLTAMAHGGYALGRDDRRMVFVPYTLPGERVLARQTHEKGQVTFAAGVKLLEASADRVYPECPHFGPGRCWGCQWQHIAYEAQLLLKQDVLADQLGRLGGFHDRVIERALEPTIPSPEQWGYNYHMTLERTADERLGFLRVDGRGIEVMAECYVLHPTLLALYESLDLDFAGMRRLKLQLGSDGAHMLVLMMASEDAPEIAADFATSVNILLPDNEPVNLIGAAHSLYTVGGRDFRVTAGSSFRANVAQVDALVAQVLALLDLRGDEAVLDLYAGVGVFSAFMAARAGLVTMVESYPPAVTDAEANLAAFDNVDVVEGAVEAVLDVLEGEYQAAVVDPPPGGLSQETFNRLIALGIPRIVYVSSDPASLARDGKKLGKQGYHLLRAQPIDFAPQTYYIDTVTLFERKSRRKR
jgi:23S rRNA (uracil1939-C5)-methyltransferase